MPESPTHEHAEQRIGRMLNGKWRLESLLGVGGTAAVYAATHRNGSRVAIKILHPAISESDEARTRFKREGYLVNRVEHPGVVRVLDDDIDETDGSAFIVMDRADGVSLCERVQRRLLDENEVLEVTEQLLDILAAAHEKGVIHRDLKPDNLLVDEAGRVRLLDFGIARLLDDDSNLTRTGFTFGTPAYMAPEQAYGRKALIGPRTDVYAVGATMFTLLSGEYVQDAESAQELLIKIATQPARSLAELCPGSSPELVDLVDRATMMHLEDRWPSAATMLERVRRVMRERGLGGSRRHISSRISAIMTVAEITEIERESGVDRSSVIRGQHTVAAAPATAAQTQAPIVAATTRPSLVRVQAKRANRSVAFAAAIALAFVGVTIGWTRSPSGRDVKAAAAQATEVTRQAIATPTSEPAEPLIGLKPTESPDVAPAIAAHVLEPVAPTAFVAPTTAGSKLTKPIRRPIDVGY